MHQPKKVKTSLSRAGLSIRVFSLSLLLLGSMLTFISAMASSSQVFAQGSPKMSTHHLTSIRPHAIVSSKKALQPKVQSKSRVLKEHVAPQVVKTQKGQQHPKSKRAALQSPVTIPGLVLTTTKTAGGSTSTATATAGAPVGSPLTETITVTGTIPDPTTAGGTVLSSLLGTNGTLQLNVVDTTQGLANVRLNPATTGWTISSSTPASAAGVATTTFTFTGGLGNPPSLAAVTPLIVDGDIVDCPINVSDTAQASLSIVNALGETGLTVPVLPTSTPAALTVPVDRTTCASATASPTASATASPTASATASPTASATASPTASATASPTASATASATASPTASATASPTASPTASATASPTASATANKPQLFLTNANTDGNVYTVGEPVTYNLTVSNLPFSLSESQTITVTDAIPTGITNLTATASEWNISLTSTTGPAELTATYVGTYPVAAGAVLPTITLTGNLTAQAVPSFTTAATVSSADDPNPALNTSINTIFVSFGAGAPTPITSVTAVPTTSVTVVPSVTATVTGTATPPSSPGSVPALAIVKVNLNGDHFKVGDKVTYVIVVSNLSSGDPVVAPNTISVTDVLPLGLTDIKVDVDGSQWDYASGDNNGPALLTVNYVGNYPVAPGQVLAPITITGKLTNDAVPYVTNTATVDTAGNSTVDNSATDTVFVDPNGNGHCCNNDGCCTDQNGNNNNSDKNNNSKNNQNDKNHGHHSGKGSNDPVSGDPTSYNGSGDPASGQPTSYNGSGDPVSSGALPHLPLTGGAPLAG